MIGSYGSYGNKFLEVSGGAVLKPGADEDLMASQDATLNTGKAVVGPKYFERREAAIRRAYLRRQRQKMAQGEAAALVAPEVKENGGGMKFLLPALILGAVGVGLFFLFRRKK